MHFNTRFFYLLFIFFTAIVILKGNHLAQKQDSLYKIRMAQNALSDLESTQSGTMDFCLFSVYLSSLPVAILSDAPGRQ